jgi:hypothetical protein
MVKRIKIHRITISTNAKRGDFKPKNRIDQSTLNISWAAKISKAIFTCGLSKPLLQTRNNDMPIRRKRMVQTGPKIQLGGLKTGLLMVRYHVLTELKVKKEPIIPASWQIATEMISKSILFILIRECFLIIKMFANYANYKQYKQNILINQCSTSWYYE